MTYYAHTRGSDKSEWQTILQHLKGTSDQAQSLGEDTGLVDFAAAAAILHDLGKYSNEFQRRLEGSPQKVDHATAGAVEIDQLSTERGQAAVGRLLAYCIAGHHSGLPDGGSPIDTEDDATLAGRFKRPIKDYSAHTQEIDKSTIVIPQRFPSEFRPIRDEQGFSLAFATRMIYSILVDADFLDTETFCNGGKKPRGDYADLRELADEFMRFLKRYDHPVREIDVHRSATLHACIEQANLPPGLFSLTLPTGAGKTLASMAFAMQHAVQHGMKRIIYVIPYTSIIEQNAAVFRSSLGDFKDHVLEHHSSFDWDSKKEKADNDYESESLQKLKWAAENWDIPIVVTTNVQFFESLYANRSSRCRKIHRMAKSVIIFDEAQMLPRELMKPCIYSVVELVRNYGASAVFCTATQPVLGHFLPKDVPAIHELIPDVQAEFNFYRRVQVHQIGKMTDAELLERINSYDQALCIVNTRRHAKTLFQGLSGDGCYHLSTLMCPAHRREVLAEIRTRLKEGLPCRVVSTQLLEAGVDLDFPVGFRALAGLDSIIQAAGRVNRENRFPTADLFVFEPDSKVVSRLPIYIQQTAKVAKIILDQYINGDPVCADAIRDYYNLLYTLKGAESFDEHEIMKCFKYAGGSPSFGFATAAQKFNMIGDETLPVIVPYDANARDLIGELESTEFPLSVVRKLQPYTVNIYRQEYDALEGRGLLSLIAEKYPVLNDVNRNYDLHMGLILPERQGGYGVYL